MIYRTQSGTLYECVDGWARLQRKGAQLESWQRMSKWMCLGPGAPLIIEWPGTDGVATVTSPVVDILPACTLEGGEGPRPC